jgi:signal peptidase II
LITLLRNADAILLPVVATTISCDQVSKHVASTHLMDGPGQSYLGDSLRLEYSENNGAFLGLGAGLPRWARTTLFSIGTGALLIGCVVAALTRHLRGVALFGLWLLFAGGLSNLVDRVVAGRVVDFLNVGIGPVRTGIFNVADMAIMLGVALLLGGSRVVRDVRDDRS